MDTQDAAIDNELSADEAIVVAVAWVGNTLGGTARENRVELRRAVPPNRWDKHGLHPYDGTDANSGSWYRKDNPFFRQGDTVRYNNKHFLCKKDHYAERWDSDLWETTMSTCRATLARKIISTTPSRPLSLTRI